MKCINKVNISSLVVINTNRMYYYIGSNLLSLCVLLFLLFFMQLDTILIEFNTIWESLWRLSHLLGECYL